MTEGRMGPVDVSQSTLLGAALIVWFAWNWRPHP